MFRISYIENHVIFTEIEKRPTVTRRERGGNFRGKGDGFVGTIKKDTWTITGGGVGWWKWEGGGEGWGSGWSGGESQRTVLEKQ